MFQLAVSAQAYRQVVLAGWVSWESQQAVLTGCLNKLFKRVCVSGLLISFGDHFEGELTDSSYGAYQSFSGTHHKLHKVFMS